MMMSENLKGNSELSLPLISLEKDDDAVTAEESKISSWNKTAKVAFALWALSATIVLVLFSLNDGWDELRANTRYIVDDLQINYVWQQAMDDDSDVGVTTTTTTTTSNVVKLDDTNWEDFHKNHKAVFVNMHLPPFPPSLNIVPIWEEFLRKTFFVNRYSSARRRDAVNSKILVPAAVWEQFASDMKTQEDWPPGVGIASVDCRQNRELCHREMISTYTTLRWYEGGQHVAGADYTPQQTTITVEHLKKFALSRLAGPPSDDEYEHLQGLSTDNELFQDSLGEGSDNGGTQGSLEEGAVAVAVTELTAATFNPWLQANEMSFVLLYASWCGWSQRLLPIWEEFAREVQQLKMPIGVGKAECMTQSDLCRDEKVMAYPTMRWYENGRPIMPDYKMDRTVQSLMAFVQRKIEIGPSEMLPNYWNPAEIDDELDVVASIKISEDDEEPPKDALWDVDEVGPSSGSAAAIPISDDELIAKFDESIDSEQEPYEVQHPAMHLNENNWDGFHQSHKAVFLTLFAPWCVWCQRLSPVWDRLAQELAERELPIGVAKVDCIAQADLCRREKVLAYPTVQWYEGGQASGPVYEGERGFEALLEYTYRRLDGDSKNEDDDDEIPEAQEEKEDAQEAELPARKILGDGWSSNDQERQFGDSSEPLLTGLYVGDDFFEGDDAVTVDFPLVEESAEPVTFYSIDMTESRWNKILVTSPDAFILFGASWSYFGQRTQIVWEQFAEQARAMNLPVAVGRVDCVKEDSLCLQESVYDNPTMRWYKNGVPTFSYTCTNDPNCQGDVTHETLIAYAQELLSGVEGQEEVWAIE